MKNVIQRTKVSPFGLKVCTQVKRTPTVRPTKWVQSYLNPAYNTCAQVMNQSSHA